MPAFINRGVPTHAKLFPYNYQYEHATFTPKQMEVSRSYISSVPHK